MEPVCREPVLCSGLLAVHTLQWRYVVMIVHDILLGGFMGVLILLTLIAVYFGDYENEL